MKATSIFGGVQVINILISLVRSKFIAVLLGPVGIGVSGMLTATTGVITGLTSFGLGISAVKDIAAAFETGNSTRIAIISHVVKKWVWITGILGLLTTLILSPWLSYISFGNYDYTFGFMILSVTLLLSQINVGHLVLLQGTRKISYLAKANVIGSILGLFTTIPLYYIWGIDGIIPAMIIAAISSVVISAYFSNKIKIEKVKVSKARNLAEGKLMLKMGFVLSLSGFITLGCSYLVRLYLIKNGSLEIVGYYNAGFSIITTYVGIIFTAMGTDYYPRLSGSIDDKSKSNMVVNQQIEIAILILGPILIGFTLFLKWIILLLYSKEFLIIDSMLAWATLGMLFKAVSWAIAFLFLANGSSKLFFWNELIANLYMLSLNVLGYNLLGLEGVGISFVISYFLYMIQVYILTNRKFDYVMSNDAKILTMMMFVFVLIAMLGYLFTSQLIGMISGFLILITVSCYSVYKLSKLFGFKKT